MHKQIWPLFKSTNGCFLEFTILCAEQLLWGINSLSIKPISKLDYEKKKNNNKKKRRILKEKEIAQLQLQNELTNKSINAQNNTLCVPL